MPSETLEFEKQKLWSWAFSVSSAWKSPFSTALKKHWNCYSPKACLWTLGAEDPWPAKLLISSIKLIPLFNFNKLICTEREAFAKQLLFCYILLYSSMWKYCLLYFAILWHKNEKQKPVVVVLAKRLRENVLSLKTFAIMMTDEILCTNGRNIITHSRPKWKHWNNTYGIKYSWKGINCKFSIIKPKY